MEELLLQKQGCHQCFAAAGLPQKRQAQYLAWRRNPACKVLMVSFIPSHTTSQRNSNHSTISQAVRKLFPCNCCSSKSAVSKTQSSAVMLCHSHCQCAGFEDKLLCTFASVRSLPYFLPDAPSTILARQGPISCCGVNAISLCVLLLLQVHGEQSLEVCLHAYLDDEKCKQTVPAEWSIAAIQ